MKRQVVAVSVRRALASAAAIAAALALAACSEAPSPFPTAQTRGTDPVVGPGTDPTADPTPAPTLTRDPNLAPTPTLNPTVAPTPTPEPIATDPVISERGYVVKEMGEPAFLIDSEVGDTLVTITISSITPNFTCTLPDAPPPAFGTHLAVSIEIAVADRVAEVDPGFFTVDQDAFRVFDTDGVAAQVDPAVGCVEPIEVIPAEIQPGETVSGLVILDSVPTSGFLAWQYGTENSGGWEVAF